MSENKKKRRQRKKVGPPTQDGALRKPNAKRKSKPTFALSRGFPGEAMPGPKPWRRVPTIAPEAPTDATVSVPAWKERRGVQ